MAVNIRKLTTSTPMLYNYKYDQLNRISSMDAWAANGSFGPTGSSPLQDYAERYSYDPNGNILSLIRHGYGSSIPMDSMSYRYGYIKTDGSTGEYVPGQTLPGGLDHLTNRLSSIGDIASTGYDDVKAQAPLHYKYDQIGNLINDSASTLTWSVFGKILTITNASGTIYYTYDASGNRISKKVGNITTWYVRDAAGNVMATYVTGDNTKNSGALTQTEVHVYGSSRLGILNLNVNCNDLLLPVNSTVERGGKFFELTNHLGNVLVTVTDKKLQKSAGGTNVDSFTVDVASASDYYPFGMQMPGRVVNSSGYRYGFNGKENDNEVKGQGNQVAFETRIYDPRLGRFLSCDPLEKTYPWQSTYVFAHNNPIKLIDVMGMGGGDPTPVYHRTSSAAAANISQNGFDPGKSNRNGFTYFSTTPEIGSIGTAAASGNTVVNATVDLSNARTITKQQMTGWFNEGLAEANKQLNTKYSSMSAVPKELQSTYQSIADGVRNTKLADFMKTDGGAIYNIAGKNTIAVAESAIGGVKVTGLSGSGAAEAIKMMSRPAMNGESAAALARYGQAANTIKWGGRACIAIAVASDLYEIYQSDNTMRTLNIKVGGWAGALAGASYGAGIGGGGGTIVPGAGNVVGTIGGGIIGGIVGYWAGSTATQIVYDYLFTKGVNAK